MTYSYLCTWFRGTKSCKRESPAVDRAENIGSAAVAAGWRTWKGDDRLLQGEVLCPDHRHDPMTKREAERVARAFGVNQLSDVGILSNAGATKTR